MNERFERIYALIKQIGNPSEKTTELIKKFELLYSELKNDKR